MSDLYNSYQVFKNNEFGEVRTVVLQNEVWFVANDVAKSLGYTNPSKATNDHCKKFKMTWGNDSLGRRQKFKIIPEGDLYRLIAHSKLPSAEEFESWVFDEVIPTIRKTGGYLGNSEEMTEEEIMAKALLVAQKTIANKNKQIEEMKPKAIFADAVASSEGTILIRELAKLLKQNGVNTGEKRLYEWLRNKGYLIKQRGADYNTPTQKAMDMKLFEIKETSITHSNGSVMISKTTKVTGKGQIYFINKLKEK